MTGRLRVGCSGYEYDGWRDVFYPPRLPRPRRFDFYAASFDTVEINTTFYRLPLAATFDNWRQRAPAGFCYALKLSRFGTHRKHLADPESWLPAFVERADRLGPMLGPVLVQLPPRWRANPERLDGFLRVAPSRLRWVVEVRDPSWLCEDVYGVLRAHGAALCIHDLLPRHPRTMTANWLYLRFHGPDALGRRYAGQYGAVRLASWVPWLREHLDAGRDAYAYFNNDLGAAAPRDAAALRLLVRAENPCEPGRVTLRGAEPSAET